MKELIATDTWIDLPVCSRWKMIRNFDAVFIQQIPPHFLSGIFLLPVCRGRTACVV